MALLKRRQPRTVPGPHVRLLVVHGEHALSSDERDLVSSICTKALKVPLESCSIIVAASEDEIPGLGGTETVTVLFGAQERIGALEESASGVTLRTRGLREILADPAAKREVWGHLKMVLPRLSA